MVLVGAFTGTVWMGSLAAIPVAVGGAIDGAVDGGTRTDVVTWCVIVAGVVIVGALAGVVRHWIAVGLYSRTRWRIERALTARVLDERGGPVGEAGQLLSLATTDAGRIGQVADLMCRGTGAIVTLVAVAVLMVTTSPLLGTIVLIGVPVTLGVVMPLWPHAERRFDDQRTQIAHATSTAADTISGLRTIRGFAGEPVARRWFGRASSSVEQSGIDLARVAGAWVAFSSAIPALFLAGVLAVAGRLALDGEIDPGDIVAFTGLATFLSIPFATIAELFITWVGGVASARRIDAVLTAPTAVDDPDRVVDRRPRATLAFDAVDAPSLRNFDLHVDTEEIVGAVCVDPEAARSITELANRRRDPDHGLVGIGGVDLRSLPLTEVRSRVLVDDAAHAWFRPGTVGDNLALGGADDTDSSTEDQRSLAALASASLDELLERSAPLATVVGGRGLRLSGGQRQRLALARALRIDPDVLVVASPTSALDSVTEVRAVDGLIERRRGRCTLLLSTSPVVLRACDRVVLVDDGAVVAEGGHAALLARSDLYRSLLGLAKGDRR